MISALGTLPTDDFAEGDRLADAKYQQQIADSIAAGIKAFLSAVEAKEKRSEGVSLWLFIGQIGASVGFVVYSVLVKNWVFSVTNGVLVANSIVGLVITRRQQTNDESSTTAPTIT